MAGFASLWQKLFFSKIALAIELILLVVLGISFIQSLTTQRDISKEIAALQQEFTELTEQQDILKSKQFLASSDAFVEVQAKEKLNLRKEGEEVIVLVDPEVSTEEIAIPQPIDDIPTISGARKWWLYFFGS
jgi:cell division protein FtsB